ncbi:MAG: hypothetical protein Q8940_22935 [Bacteroidota bacterium]|nr:hypothetical protein [Bacteroidota bacterium]
MYVPRGYEVAEERPEIPPDELLALYEFNFIGNISKKLSKSRCSGKDQNF